MPLRKSKRRQTARRSSRRSRLNFDSFEQIESKYTQAQQDLKSCAEQMTLHGLTSVKDLKRWGKVLQGSEEAIHQYENSRKAVVKQLKKTYPTSLLESLKNVNWSTTATPEPGENMTDDEESIYDPESDPETASAPAPASARNRARSGTICALNESEPDPSGTGEMGGSAAATSANQHHQPTRLDSGTRKAARVSECPIMFITSFH